MNNRKCSLLLRMEKDIISFSLPTTVIDSSPGVNTTTRLLSSTRLLPLVKSTSPSARAITRQSGKENTPENKHARKIIRLNGAACANPLMCVEVGLGQTLTNAWKRYRCKKQRKCESKGTLYDVRTATHAKIVNVGSCQTPTDALKTLGAVKLWLSNAMKTSNSD